MKQFSVKDIVMPEHWLLFLLLFSLWSFEIDTGIILVSLWSWLSVVFTLFNSVLFLSVRYSLASDKIKKTLYRVVKNNSKSDSKVNIGRIFYEGIFTVGLSGLFYHLGFLYLGIALMTSQLTMHIVMSMFFYKSRADLNKSTTKMDNLDAL